MLVGGTHSQATAKLVKRNDQIFSVQIVEEENPTFSTTTELWLKPEGCSARQADHNTRTSINLQYWREWAYILQYPLSEGGVKGETPCGSKLELPVGNSARVSPAKFRRQSISTGFIYVDRKSFIKGATRQLNFRPKQWGKKWRCQNKLILTK